MNPEYIIPIPPYIYNESFLEELYPIYLDNPFVDYWQGSLWENILISGIGTLPSAPGLNKKHKQDVFGRLVRLYAFDLKFVYKEIGGEPLSRLTDIYSFIENIDFLPSNFIDKTYLDGKYYTHFVYSVDEYYMVTVKNHFQEALSLVKYGYQ